MLNQQGNANPNHTQWNEISPPTCQNGCYQKVNKQVLVRMWRKGSPAWALLLGLQIGAAAMKNSMEVPRNSKNRTITRPSNSTSGYSSEEIQNTNSKRCTHPTSTAALFTLAKTRKQRECPPTGERMKKMWYRHTHNGVLFSLKKKSETLPSVTIWIHLRAWY